MSSDQFTDTAHAEDVVPYAVIDRISPGESNISNGVKSITCWPIVLLMLKIYVPPLIVVPATS